jgi:hypothetical protein
MRTVYSTPARPDPLAAAERAKMRQQRPRDLCSKSLRLALHLSVAEHQALQKLNPETLGSEDMLVRSGAWADFIARPESAPYRVNQV